MSLEYLVTRLRLPKPPTSSFFSPLASAPLFSPTTLATAQSFSSTHLLISRRMRALRRLCQASSQLSSISLYSLPRTYSVSLRPDLSLWQVPPSYPPFWTILLHHLLLLPFCPTSSHQGPTCHCGWSRLTLSFPLSRSDLSLWQVPPSYLIPTSHLLPFVTSHAPAAIEDPK